MDKILITPKINPDLDGVACAYAYAKFLNLTDKENRYVAGVYGQPQAEARFLLESLNIKEGIIYNPNDNFDKFIIVDASDLKGMPEIIRPQDVLEVIDHREVHNAAEIFSKAKTQIELVGAAATLIFEKLRQGSFPLEKEVMFLLYGAIFSNTLNLKSDLVTGRDLEAVRFIADNLTAHTAEKMIVEMFKYKSEYISNNLEEVIRDDFKIFNHHGKLGIAQIEGFDLADLLERRRDDLINILKRMKEEHDLEIIFLTAADINNNRNIFLVIDDYSKSLLEEKLGLLFNSNNIAENSKLLLRKQILPLLI